MQKNTEIKSQTVAKTKHGKMMLLSNCLVCGNKKPRFIKGQEASRLMSLILGLRTPLASILVIGNILG